MADVTELVEYYQNLLIIQYNNKEKARATIKSISEALLASGILFDIRDGFNIDNAVGAQLDVIGKYVGLDRFYTMVQDPIDYFAFTDYEEIDPDEEEKFGLTDYANFDDFQYNGTLNYSSVLTQDNKLNDEDFRSLIKLRIIQNNSNHSHKSIDDAIWQVFGDSVVPSSEGDMHMIYFLRNANQSIIEAALTKGVLPRPMGVGVSLIRMEEEFFFGMTSYSDVLNGIDNPLSFGFSDYGTFESEDGGFLSYTDFT